jgi:hypothetical protein
MQNQAEPQPGSQYERTMRDLVQYDRGDQAPQPIKTRRKATEMRLDKELRRANSFLNLRQVMAFTFESDAQGHRTHLELMLTAFNRDVDDVDQSLLQLLQDVWNFFPHRFLDGRCPAERFNELGGNSEQL